MNSLKLKNSFLLLLTAFIWGIAFVVQDSGGDALGPFTFNCLRAFIGGIVLLPTIKILDHTGLTYMKPKTKKEKKTLIIGGISCGIALFIASNIQQLGRFFNSLLYNYCSDTWFILRQKMWFEYLDWSLLFTGWTLFIVHTWFIFINIRRYIVAFVRSCVFNTYTCCRPLFTAC